MLRRSFGTTAQPVVEASKKFAHNRRKFADTMTTLRKQWTQESERSLQQDLERKKAEDKRFLIDKAIRIRAKKQIATAKDLESRRIRDNFARLFKEHVVSSQMIREARQKASEQRYRQLRRDISEEASKAWVTADNLEKKITTELFTTPSTTGLKTTTSEFWRVQAITLNMDREMGQEMIDEYRTNFANRTLFLNQRNFERKVAIRDYVGSLVGSGKERDKYDELVKEFSNRFSEGGSYDDFIDSKGNFNRNAEDPDAWYFDALEELDDGSDHENGSGSGGVSSAEHMVANEAHESSEGESGIIVDDFDELDADELDDDFEEEVRPKKGKKKFGV